MIVYLANKTQFLADILSNRIVEIVHDSFKGELGKSVGASELSSWKNSLRHMDTVLEDSGIPHNAKAPIVSTFVCDGILLLSLVFHSAAFCGELPQLHHA